MGKIYHHLLRDDLGIDHAMINSRTMGILAPCAGTDLEIWTQMLSRFTGADAVPVQAGL